MKRQTILLILLLIFLSTISGFAKKAAVWHKFTDDDIIALHDKDHFLTLDQTRGSQLKFKIYQNLFDHNYNELTLTSTTEDTYEFRKAVFTSPLECYILVDSTQFDYVSYVNLYYKYFALMYKTTDGGKTWERIELNSKMVKKQSKDFYMNNSNDGIFIQHPDTLNLYSKVLVTNDGWKTFREITNHTARPLSKCYYDPPYIYLNELQFKEHISTDDGKTFDVKSEIANYGEIRNFQIYHREGEKTKFYLFVLDPVLNLQVYESQNKGQSWDYIRLMDSLNYNDISFFKNDSSFYYNVPDGGIKLKPAFTNNNFKTFVYQDNIIDYNISSLTSYRYSDDSLVIATTSSGGYYHIIGDSTLSVPEIYAPEKIYRIPKDVELKWHSVEGATHYQIQVVERDGRDYLIDPYPPANYDSDLFAETITSELSYKLPNTKYYKYYSCRIRAFNDSLSSEWIEINFLTEKDPNSVVNSVILNQNLTFPNPARSTARVSLQQEGQVSITAVDLLGRSYPLWSGYASTGTLELDVSALPTGSYTLLIDYGTKREAVRMMKE